VAQRSGVTSASTPPRAAPGSTLSQRAPRPSPAPSAAGAGPSALVPAAEEPGTTLSRSEEVPLPLTEMHMDMEVLTEGLQKAIAVVRAAEYSLNGQIKEYAQKMETRVDMAHRSEDRLTEELRSRTKELVEAQATLEACHSEVEGARAVAAAESESRGALMQELAKANDAVLAGCGERREMQAELQQARAELAARQAELQQIRDDLRASGEGTAAARLREEELEERIEGLREAERALQAELREAQAALQGQLGKAQAELEEANAELAEAREELSKNERDLRNELAQVQAELGVTKAELQRRQKCCFRFRSKPVAARKAKECRAGMDC